MNTDDPRTITDEWIENQPIPCLAGNGQSCGIWIYCDREHGHPGMHGGWSATVEVDRWGQHRAERTRWAA